MLAHLDTILSNPRMINLESISILPDYPTPFHQFVSAVAPFNFGLQLVRTQRPIKSLTYGLPLELTTNPSSRQHLRHLGPPRLDLTFMRPSVELFNELTGLVRGTTTHLGIRYVPTRNLVAHDVFLCESLEAFERIDIHLHLPRARLTPNGEDPMSTFVTLMNSLISALESSSEQVQRRYKVWKVEGWETAGQVASATRTRLWPAAVLFDLDATEPIEEIESEPVRTTSDDNWERETNYKLLGGMISLNLESKRHRARQTG